MNFTTHDIKTAPDESKPLLEQVVKDYSFIPNLYGVLADSPPVLQSMLDISKNVSQTTLTPAEHQVGYLSISFENDCVYCMSGHSGLAKMIDVPDDMVNSLRRGEKLSDPKLEALSVFAKKILKSKGYVEDGDLQSFLNAGYSKANALDVVLIIAQKILANYIGHIVNVQVDDAFAPFEWKRRVAA